MEDQVLFTRFHAAFDVEPPPGAFANLGAALVQQPVRAPRRAWFRFELRPEVRRVVAAVALIAIIAAAVGAFLAISHYVHRNVPIHVPKVTATATCSQGFRMYSATEGWQGSESHTSDGGLSWQINVPTVANQSKGFAECTVDALHAWTAMAVGSPPTAATGMVVLETADGGTTWQQRGSVPASGFYPGAELEFINDQVGWFLVDSAGASRKLYVTVDGGYHWSDVGAAGLDNVARGCSESGMIFVSSDRGWLTWDCTNGPKSGTGSPGGAVVAVTSNGGHSWTPVPLTGMPSDLICSAHAPLFTGTAGVMPMVCTSNAQPAWAGVYRTDDAGLTWTLGVPPFQLADLYEVSFADASDGFALAGSQGLYGLYKTTNSGQTWTVVKKAVFVSQDIPQLQFVDTNVGFAATSSSQGGLWQTTDGGLTWGLPGHRVIAGNIGCPAPSTPGSGAAPLPVLMASATTGWAVGALHTTDSGLHWSSPRIPSPPDQSAGYAEYFLDADHAWVVEAAGSARACADHVVVFSTADGGATWQQMGSVAVPGATLGDVIWGQQPSSASPFSERGGAPSLSFVDPLHGWMEVMVCGQTFMDCPISELLYRTGDGGATWSLLVNETAGSGPCSLPTGIVFSSVTTGWGPLGGCGSSGGPIAVTHDGGLTWTPQPLDVGSCCDGGPLFIDAVNGVVLGSTTSSGAADDLLTTSDGGVTWTMQSVPALGIDPTNESYTLDDFGFSSPSEGWMLYTIWGPTQVTYRLYHTADGGKTWKRINEPIPPQPGSETNFPTPNFYFLDANLGFISSGTDLFRTTDGGRTWTRLSVTVN